MRTITIPEITITAEWDGDSLHVEAQADVPEDLKMIHTAGARVHPTCKVREHIEQDQIERALRGLINRITSNKDFSA